MGGKEQREGREEEGGGKSCTKRKKEKSSSMEPIVGNRGQIVGGNKLVANTQNVVRRTKLRSQGSGIVVRTSEERYTSPAVAIFVLPVTRRTTADDRQPIRTSYS